MAKPRPYGVIYNWDGAPHGSSKVPQSIDAFVDKVYAPIEDTQVGALFWCVGEHAAKWDSDTLEILGDEYGRRYESASNYIHTENIRKMLDRGEDPHPPLINRGRELGVHVYASLRMNDNHFGGARPQDLATLHHTELTRLRIEHPQWLLGDTAASDWFAASWNMSIAEVRQNRYDHIKEVCTRYDWDGVELDWQRHAFHLPEDDAYRLRYVLTDLQRAVRKMTNEISRQRGKPFYLAARVAPRLETCFKIGYDIPAWVEEDLVDVLIPAANAATDPSVNVSEFRDLCSGRDIAVYPGLDGGLPDQFVGPEDATAKNHLRTCAITHRYHRNGADGIYVFNWHADRQLRRPLLTRIGSAESLRKTDKIYAATHRYLLDEGDWRGAYRPDRVYAEVPVPLRPTVTGDGPTIRLDVADDFVIDPPRDLELRVRLDQWVEGDVVAVQWDDGDLAGPDVRYCRINDPHHLSDVSFAAWLCFSIDPSQCSPGLHKVKIILHQRHPQLACDLVLTDVELVVRYADMADKDKSNG